MRKLLLAILVSAWITTISTPADAMLITSRDDLIGPTTVIDFSNLDTIQQWNQNGPVQIGGEVGRDVIWSASEPYAQVGPLLNYGLVDNGFWTSVLNGFTGLNNRNGFIRFDFGSPVQEVGGFINYARTTNPANVPFDDVILTALDKQNNVLESYALTGTASIVTPFAANAGSFRGILRPTEDISAFTLSNAYVVLDDLQFTSAVPEPTTIMLLGFGIAGLAGVRRKFRTKLRKG